MHHHESGATVEQPPRISRPVALRLSYSAACRESSQGMPPLEEDIRIVPAWSRKARRRRYTLVKQVYLRSGLIEKDAPLVLSQPESSDCLPLLVETRNGRALGTVSLVFDSGSDSLPCEEVFRAPINALRKEGRRICEVSALAFDTPAGGSRQVVERTFNLIYLYAHRIRRFHDFVVEVHPRHASFYQRHFGFEMLAGERPCPRVCGAPAILLGVDLSRAGERVSRLKQLAAGSRRYAEYALSRKEEDLAMQALSVWCSRKLSIDSF